MNNLTIIQGDCRDVLKTLPDASVQCCVTSPPYWGLRDYGTASWVGGEADCDHLKPAAHGYAPHDTSTLGPKRDGLSPDNSAHAVETKRQQFRTECGKCGAIRVDRQIGIEPTPEEYVATLVEVFREVRRVLRDDGTVWLNLGDTYAGSGKGGNPEDSPHVKQRTNKGTLVKNGARSENFGLKAKDLIGIPWLVTMALRGAGWYLRSEITWCKKAPMPESVTDRPTSATEKIFLLTKSADYYYDADAVRNPPSEAMLKQVAEGYNGHGTKLFEESGVQNASDVKSRIIENARKRVDKQRGRSRRHAGLNDRWDHMTKDEQMACGSNMRNFWLIGPEPYADAHFATFPTEIPRRCILAGTKPSDVVLDPFGGSGTTGMVALELGRKAILIELNPDYANLAESRCNVTPGLALA